MKAFSLTLIFILSGYSTSLAETVPTVQLRKLFHNAVLDRRQIPVFLNQVKKIRTPTPVEMAYLAAAEALKAQEEWNPIEKLTYLRRFKKLISKAIELDAEEIEIRFLRFGIEFNIPGILGFSSDLQEDKAVIMDTVSRIDRFEVDQFFTTYILTLLADSGLCSEEEIELVKSKIQI